MEIEALQQQLAKNQQELGEKLDKIEKLKGLLTRSMRSDKRREQQIEILQIDLADRDRRIESLNLELEEHKVFSAKQSMRIGQLEEELNELNNRLNNGIGSEIAQKKNEKMKQMLEKSNSLYAELETRYQKLTEQLQTEKEKKKSYPIPSKVIIIGEKDSYILYSDGTYKFVDSFSKLPEVETYDFRKALAQNEKNAIQDSSFIKVYLRKVFLEFFIGDPLTQNRLIPVILQLLECTKDQIIAAQRNYAEGRQIIAKATAVLNI